MMQPTTKFIVTEKAMRPASLKQECFYCHQPIGADHKDDCVLVNRRATVRMTIEYEVEIPAFWTAHEFEFHRNEGSWCADNAIQEIKDYLKASGQHCMCDITTFEYIESTSEPYLNEA